MDVWVAVDEFRVFSSREKAIRFFEQKGWKSDGREDGDVYDREFWRVPQKYDLDRLSQLVRLTVDAP